MKESLFFKNPAVLAFRVLTSLSAITLLFIVQFNNFFLFHYIVESLSIIIGLLIFAVVWSGRDIINNKPVILLGIAYFFIAILDSCHLATYPGMGFINIDNSDFATQTWIVARYMEALSILFVSLTVKKLYPKLIFLVYLMVTSLILLSIFTWNIFPSCYIEGTGLTAFKILSEYIIIGILFFSLIFVLYHRINFHKQFVLMLSTSIIVTILSEFCFTLNIGVYDFINALGHILKVISYILIYKAIFVEGIKNPQQLLFRKLNDKQKETLNKLKESETLYQTLLDSLPQRIFFENRDLNYISCNSSYARNKQLKKSEIIGRNIYDVHPKILADRYKQEDLDIMNKGEIEEFEDTFTTGNQEITIQIVKVPVRDVDGSIIGLLGIFWDITEQKKIKAELEEYRNHLEDLVYKKTLTLNNTNKLLEEEINERKQMEENLIEARNEAEKANKAKNDFLAQMSHNLRTPLNSILGYTQLFLEDTEIMNQYESQIKMVHQSGLYLSSMINKILDLRNIGTGEMEAALFETEFTNSLTEPDVRNKDRETDNTIFPIPPNEELLRLLELEKVGDIIGIESLINKIEKDDAGYLSFVKRIRKFTGLYQTEKLVAYINSLLGRRT